MKPCNFSLFLSISLFFFLSVNAQKNKKVDSLTAIYNSLPDNEKKIRVLSSLYDVTEFTDPDLAKTYVDLELELAKKLRNVKEIGSAYYNLACYYDNKDNRDSSNYYLKKAKEKYLESNHEHGIMIVQHFEAGNDYYDGNYDSALKKLATVMVTREKRKEYSNLAYDYSFKGLLYQSKNYYKLALENFIQGFKILDTIKGQDYDKANFLGHIAAMESELGNVAKAIEYEKKSIKIYEQLDYTMQQAFAKTRLANSYTKLDDYETAISYARQGLELAKKIEAKEEQHDAYSALGYAYFKAKDYPKSIHFTKLALEFRQELGRTTDIIQSLHQLSTILNETNQPDAALLLLNQSLVLADTIQNARWLQRLYRNRADSYKKKKQFSKALGDYEKWNTLKDSLSKINNTREIEELRIIYETEKKEQQLLLQDKEITVLEQEAKISKQQKLLLGGGLGLAMAALGFGFYGFRQRSKRNRLEKEKVEAELAFKKKELTTHALHLAKKNEVLESVKLKAKALKEKEGVSGYQELIKTINFDQQDDKNWESFTQYFEQVHKDFASNVKKSYPEVTKNELRFMALLKMNMSSKEIATILNISSDGIKKARQRLRKKMGLSPNDSLENTVLAI